MLALYARGSLLFAAKRSIFVDVVLGCVFKTDTEVREVVPERHWTQNCQEEINKM